MSNPSTGNSVEANETPFNNAFNIKATYWEMMGQSDQEYRQRRFGIGMKGVAALESTDAILKGTRMTKFIMIRSILFLSFT